MDSVSAIGLASAIVSFIGLGVKLLHGAKEIRDSANDSLEKNESRQAIAEAMQEAVAKLKTPHPAQIPPEQQKLCDLAVKCNDLSQRILELLNKIKPKNKKPLHVYRAAFHAWRSEDDIKVLEKSLGDCRSQLALSLTHLASKNSAENSGKILAMVQEDSSKLEQLQAHMKQLRKGVEAQVIGDEALEQLRLVLGIHDEALSAIYQHRILCSLQFEDMHRRDDRVLDPYENTFRWILEGDHDSSKKSIADWENLRQKEMRIRSRKMFLNWLSSGSGIFHVSGELGSGKSTLMKFICTHPRTRSEIEKWVGDRTMVLASFFFWKPGSELQKSLQGLFRSLLCDILTACPDLIRDTLPEYWLLAEQSPWQIQTRFNIPSSTVNSALNNVISDECLYKGHRFCFFIDGLDEYEGTDEQDPTHLVTLLNTWVKDSHGCLKLCVSSREHNVFMNALSKDQRLRLHELTLFDMQEYVAGYLQDMQSDTLSDDLRDKLATSIPEKAGGIFLWTILVVRTIRRKIEDGEPEGRLMKLLDSLPQGLSSVLQRILEDLDAANRRRLFQTIAMLRVAKANHLQFSLLAFSFLDDYEQDAKFSIKGHIPTKKAKAIAQRRLRGACGGLVETEVPRHWTYKEGSFWGRLDYTHRSVPDMFGEGALKREMDVFLEGFDAMKAILHLNFAAIQFIGDPETREPWNLCILLAIMLLENEIEEAPCTLLERIASWFERNSPQLKPGSEIYLRTYPTMAVPLGALTSNELVSGPLERFPCHSVLCLAGYLGCFSYVKWKVKQAPKATSSSRERAFLAHAVLHKSPKNPSIEDFFFDDGIFTDVTAIGYVAAELGHGPVQAGNLTIWQRFLVFEFLEWALPDIFRRDVERPGRIIQKFLEHGASRHFYLEAEYNESDEGPNITFAFEATDVSLRPRTYVDNPKVSPGFLKMLGEGQAASRYTFRDWIRASDYPNKNRILELLGDDGKAAAVTGDDERSEGCIVFSRHKYFRTEIRDSYFFIQ